MEGRFKPGDRVVYAPQDSKGVPYKLEHGIVKLENPRRPGVYFVYYHCGCTAAATDSMYLMPYMGTLENFDSSVHSGCEQCGGNLFE